MIDNLAAMSQTRRAYDHRLREHAIRSGTRCLPRHLAIPRSTGESRAWSETPCQRLTPLRVMVDSLRIERATPLPHRQSGHVSRMPSSSETGPMSGVTLAHDGEDGIARLLVRYGRTRPVGA